MATLNYYPRLQKSKGGNNYTYIYLRFSENKNYQFSTGMRLHSKSSWNKRTKKIRDLRSEPNSKYYNQVLNKFKVYFLNEYKKLIDNNVPINNASIRKIYESYDESEKKIFNTLFEDFIRLRKTTQLKKNGKPYLKRTIQNYNSTYKLIKAFQKEYGNIDLKKINIELYHRIVHFLRTTNHLKRRKKKQLVLFGDLNIYKNYSESYIEKIISTLKSFFSYIIRVKNIKLPEYSHKDWS